MVDLSEINDYDRVSLETDDGEEYDLVSLPHSEENVIAFSEVEMLNEEQDKPYWFDEEEEELYVDDFKARSLGRVVDYEVVEKDFRG